MSVSDVKLSHRLKRIEQLIQDKYEHIWDCCCDHGHLGISLLQRPVSAKVHFIDKVPSITDQLTTRLDRWCPISGGLRGPSWTVQCLDVEELQITDEEKKGRHLFIIAGIGGEQTLLLLQCLLGKYPDIEMEFILCPLRHCYVLRQGLISAQLKLLNEHLIQEKKWYYEVIHVTKKGDAQQDSDYLPLTATGHTMWQDNPLAGGYLEQTLSHYKKMLRSSPEVNQPILAAYQSLEIGCELTAR